MPVHRDPAQELERRDQGLHREDAHQPRDKPAQDLARHPPCQHRDAEEGERPQPRGGHPRSLPRQPGSHLPRHECRQRHRGPRSRKRHGPALSAHPRQQRPRDEHRRHQLLQELSRHFPGLGSEDPGRGRLSVRCPPHQGRVQVAPPPQPERGRFPPPRPRVDVPERLVLRRLDQPRPAQVRAGPVREAGGDDRYAEPRGRRREKAPRPAQLPAPTHDRESSSPPMGSGLPSTLYAGKAGRVAPATRPTRGVTSS